MRGVEKRVKKQIEKRAFWVYNKYGICAWVMILWLKVEEEIMI